jgi:hypothetical protein
LTFFNGYGMRLLAPFLISSESSQDRVHPLLDFFRIFSR